MTIGVYHPGESILHRARPGLKLLGLAAYAVALSLSIHPGLDMGLIGLLVVLWAASRLPWTLMAASLKPLIWILAALFAFQVVAAGVTSATTTLITIMALVVAAALVSFTTRTDDMLETLNTAFNAFARFGLNPQTAAFAVVFTIRLIPFIATVGHDAIAARMARGGGRHVFGAVVPVMIRLMRETDAIGEALVARGFGRA